MLVFWKEPKLPKTKSCGNPLIRSEQKKIVVSMKNMSCFRQQLC